MSINLIVSLSILSILWLILILTILKKGKIPIKYSLIWIIAVCILLLVVIAPGLLEFMANILGFETVSNMVAGIMFILLLYITMVLTMIVSKQKENITLLIQEISMLKQEVENVKGSVNK